MSETGIIIKYMEKGSTPTPMVICTVVNLLKTARMAKVFRPMLIKMSMMEIGYRIKSMEEESSPTQVETSIPANGPKARSMVKEYSLLQLEKSITMVLGSKAKHRTKA